MQGGEDCQVVKLITQSKKHYSIKMLYGLMSFIQEEDELPEGKSVGMLKNLLIHRIRTKKEIKVSDVEGDINVAGLFLHGKTINNYNDLD